MYWRNEKSSSSIINYQSFVPDSSWLQDSSKIHRFESSIKPRLSIWHLETGGSLTLRSPRRKAPRVGTAPKQRVTVLYNYCLLSLAPGRLARDFWKVRTADRSPPERWDPMRGYRLFSQGVHRDAPGGAIARVVIVVYGELIAAAWDDARLANGWTGTRPPPRPDAIHRRTYTYPRRCQCFVS